MATQTVEQVQRLPADQEKFLADILASARALFEGDGTLPYADQVLAGLSDEQKLAIKKAGEGVGTFQQYLQQGSDAIQKGIAGAQGAQYSPDSYKEFMDPFLEDVIQQQYKDIAREGQKQQLQAQASAVGAGAFGGSRQGILQGELARNTAEQQARTGAQLRSQGFAQAQSAAQQAANQALQQAQLSGQLGVSQAGLGQMGQQMAVQDINTLLGIGGLQQSQEQKQLDIDRANELGREGLPFQRIGFLSDVLRGVPSMNQTYMRTSTPPPSTGSQLLGLLTAGIGGIGAAGGFNNFFGR